MFFFRHQRRRAVGSQLPTLLLALCMGVSGAALLILPNVRLVENVDSGPLNERNEQSTTTVRTYVQRCMRCDALRWKVVTSTNPNVRLEHSQSFDQHAPKGHRLPNGLLAPLTC